MLAVGVDAFGGKSGGLRLDMRPRTPKTSRTRLLESQKVAPGKPGLYADVVVQYLPNDQANYIAILDALDAMARRIRGDGSDQDLAVILVSSQRRDDRRAVLSHPL